jgi:hypothetical protein
MVVRADNPFLSHVIASVPPGASELFRSLQAIRIATIAANPAWPVLNQCAKDTSGEPISSWASLAASGNLSMTRR